MENVTGVHVPSEAQAGETQGRGVPGCLVPGSSALDLQSQSQRQRRGSETEWPKAAELVVELGS